MKSNVEINLFQKIKERRKRRKWIHPILQESSKLKNIYPKYSHSSEQCGFNRSRKTYKKKEDDSETGYDITNMDNTLNNREREEGEKPIPKK